MRPWKRPDLPEGSMRELNEALHALRLAAGNPSARDIERWVGARVVSRTTIHQAFTRPVVPRWGVVELVVEQLAARARGNDVPAEVARFKALWERAAEAYRLAPPPHPEPAGGPDQPPEVPAQASPGGIPQSLWSQATEGNVEAMYRLGVELEDKSGKGAPSAEALGWLDKAAEAGHADAAYRYARGLWNAIGRGKKNCGAGYYLPKLSPVNIQKVKKHLVRASETGHLDAAFLLYLLPRSDFLSGTFDELLIRTAEAGHIGAMAMLGEKTSGEKGEYWLRRAAEAGHIWARGALVERLRKQNRTEEAGLWEPLPELGPGIQYPLSRMKKD